jgi:hypothetical protein
MIPKWRGMYRDGDRWIAFGTTITRSTEASHTEFQFRGKYPYDSRIGAFICWAFPSFEYGGHTGWDDAEDISLLDVITMEGDDEDA